ncbi:protein kinase [bacterium]|nr:protein kinase [bacterium]
MTDLTQSDTGTRPIRCSQCGELVMSVDLTSEKPPPNCPFIETEIPCPMISTGREHLPLPRTSVPEPDPSEGTRLIGTDPTITPEFAGMLGDGFPAVDNLVHSELGQYWVEEIIGRGSMGRVYRATHSSLERPCALKILSPGLLRRKPLIRDRFWVEARAVAGLVHPHIVTVHNLGGAKGYHYIEMEFVPGGVSLREAVVRNGALEVPNATDLIRQVCFALDAAHRAGLVHRDVKPANILLSGEGMAKLADFGLVLNVNERSEMSSAVSGTPTFMAPELFMATPATPQSDIYALGVTYFYLLTAQLPYSSENVRQLIRMHRTATIPDTRQLNADVPERVQHVIERCLAKDPEDRYDSAEELAAELEDLMFDYQDIESIVRESLESVDGLVQGGSDLWRVIMRLPRDRIQEVYLEIEKGPLGQTSLTVYSVCGPADPANFEFALRLNNDLPYVGISIRDVNGQAMFIMTRTFDRASLRSSEIRNTIHEIARRADWVEELLTKMDLY